MLANGKPSSVPPVFDDDAYQLPTVYQLRQAGWPKARDSLARSILAISIRAGAYDLADGIQQAVHTYQGVSIITFSHTRY